MLRLALAFALGITLVFPSIAEETNKKYFYTRQECYPAMEFMELVINWGELALFTATGMTMSYEGTPFTGGSMFFVNQESGTWTLGTAYADGTVCINAAGTDFKPYTK